MVQDVNVRDDGRNYNRHTKLPEVWLGSIFCHWVFGLLTRERMGLSKLESHIAFIYIHMARMEIFSQAFLREWEWSHPTGGS